MRLSEQSINAVLADLIFEKLNEWFSRIAPGQLVKMKSKRAELDIYLTELFGLKIAMEAKVGHNNIELAEDKCVERVIEGFADACFAIAYDEAIRDAHSIEEAKKMLRDPDTRLRVTVILPDTERLDLGAISLDDLVEKLNKHTLYDKIVSKDVIADIAAKLRQHLDRVSDLDTRVLEQIAEFVEENFEIHGGGNIEEEEEE